jgi:hypothetical protein
MPLPWKGCESRIMRALNCPRRMPRPANACAGPFITSARFTG